LGVLVLVCLIYVIVMYGVWN